MNTNKTTTHRISHAYFAFGNLVEVRLYDWDTDNTLVIWYAPNSRHWVVATEDDDFRRETITVTKRTRFCDAFKIAWEQIQLDRDQMTRFMY